MKKFLYLVLSIMILVLPFSVYAKKTTTKEIPRVNVYVFYSDSCGYCAKLHEFTNELAKDKKMNKKFKVVDYEVSNQVNSELMLKVGSYFDKNVTGVPVYVVGDQYFSGWSETSGDALISAINEEYDDKNYIDIVDGIKNGTINVETEENSKKESSSNDFATYIILGAVIIIVLALVFGRTKDTFESVEENINKTDNKKTENKKTNRKRKK